MLKAALGVAASISVSEMTFDQWMVKHEKKYTGNEYDIRKGVFEQTRKKVLEHNAGGHSWTQGLGPFADLTPEEFKAKYLTGFKPDPAVQNAKEWRGPKHVGDLPQSFDWVAKGAVTDIKDQGNCGSCWSFSTSGAIEGYHYIKTGKLVSLSEQQFIDCSSTASGNNGTMNQGCLGGDMRVALQFAAEWSSQGMGVDTENDYYYNEADRTFNSITNPTPVADDDPGIFDCQMKSYKPAATISGWAPIAPNNETILAMALLQQPVSIGVATGDAWQNYAAGILDGVGNCPGDVDHGVLLVSFGVDNGEAFWNIKNSWGVGWGENGFIRIGRSDAKTNYGPAGQCLITTYAQIPL